MPSSPVQKSHSCKNSAHVHAYIGISSQLQSHFQTLDLKYISMKLNEKGLLAYLTSKAIESAQSLYSKRIPVPYSKFTFQCSPTIGESTLARSEIATI